MDGVKSLAQQLAGLNTDIEALSSPTAGAVPPAAADLSNRASRITAAPVRPARGGSQPYQAQVPPDAAYSQASHSALHIRSLY